MPARYSSSGSWLSKTVTSFSLVSAWPPAGSHSTPPIEQLRPNRLAAAGGSTIFSLVYTIVLATAHR